MAATIEVSLRRLTPDEQARYRELAVFGEDVAIPGEVVARLWAHTGGWTRFQARRLCRRLFDLGLLAGYRRDPDRLVLHDVIRTYLREHKPRARRAEWDAAVVDAHRDLLPPGRRVGRPARRARLSVVVVGGAPVRRRVGATSWRRCWPTRGGWSASWNGSGRPGWSPTCGCPSGRRRGRWRPWCGRTPTCSARSTRPGRWRRRSPPGCPTTPAWTSCASRSSPPSTAPTCAALAPLPDLPHDALLRVLTGHTDGVQALAVAPDGTWLASAGDDRDGADLGPAHRTDPPHPHRPHQPGAGAGGRPGRHLAGLRRRRRDGADLGPAHRTDPPHPHRPHQHGASAGGRPGRHLAGLRRRRPTRCGSGTRTPDRPATPSPATPARCRRWRSPRTAPGWPPPATTATVRIWDPHTGQTRHTLTGHTGSGASAGGRPGRQLAGLRRRRRRRCGSGTRTPGRPATPSPATPARCRRWRSPRTAPGWPPPATTTRCGSGTRTPAGPPHPHRPHRPGAGAGGRPGRHLAGLRRRRRHGADLGPAHRTDPPHPHRPHRLGGGAGGRPGRHLAGLRRRRPDGADLGPAHRTQPATPSPATPTGAGAGGRPGRHLAGLRRADDADGADLGPAHRAARHTLTGHTGRVRALAVAPDGTWLASAGDDGRCGSGTRTPGSPPHPHRHTTARCGRWRSPRTAAGWPPPATTETVRIWDPRTGSPATPSPATPAQCGRWRSPRTAPGWPPPATTGRCGSGTRHRTQPATPSPATPARCGRWRSPRTAAGWPPPATTDGADLGPQHRHRCHTLTGHTGAVRALAVAPDGSWLASASNDDTVRIWDPDTGQARHTLTGHTSSVRALAVGPDGRWLASASDDRTVRIWNTATGLCQHVLTHRSARTSGHSRNPESS